MIRMHCFYLITIIILILLIAVVHDEPLISECLRGVADLGFAPIFSGDNRSCSLAAVNLNRFFQTRARSSPN